MKRLLGPLLLVVLVVGVGAAIYFSASQQFALSQVVTVKGLIGSEKEAFFTDPKVVDALRKGGIVVQFDKAGSRTIAKADLSTYDFAFPAGVPAATELRKNQKFKKAYDEFFTPMAIASWKPIVKILVDNGIAKDQGGYYTFDMEAYLKLVAADKRWNTLEKVGADFNVNKSILITSTDVTQSNSAAMYLSLASYVANDNNVVQSDADIQKVMPVVSPLFLKQGFTEYSSEVPFQDFVSMGMGKAPMVMIYEAQYIDQAALPNGISSDMVLMYPEPTIFSKHTLIALTANGEKLGELLQTDPDLQRLAVENGFRNSNTELFKQVKNDRKLKLPDTLVDVIDPPSFDNLEKMINLIKP